MIIVTGAAGFIGSCLVKKLNEEGFKDLVLVDEFGDSQKMKNLEQKEYSHQINRLDFHQWLDDNHQLVQFIFHIGARTDTTEFNKEVFDRLNLNYSKKIWKQCVEYGLPLVYASSAATYGMGELGYDDDHEVVPQLKPLNPYGDSKNDFDNWALREEKKTIFLGRLKIFQCIRA